MTAAQPQNATLVLTSAVRHVTVLVVQHPGTRNVFRGVEKATRAVAMPFPM